MYATRAVVLKKMAVGEADELVTLYTADFGKIRARAQGVKKEGAKLRGHLETLTISVIGFVLGKNGERLTHSRMIESFPRIRGDSERLAAACQMARIIDDACMEGERDERLWSILEQGLRGLETSGHFDISRFQDFVKEALGY